MLKPLYKNFDNDYVDFWSLLDVQFGASESEIDMQYFKHLKTQNMKENIDEYYVGFKLL